MQADALITKIRTRSPERVVEVENIVDFLTQKDRREAALDRILRLAPAAQVAGAEPISESDILAEIAATRADRLMRRRTGN